MRRYRSASFEGRLITDKGTFTHDVRGAGEGTREGGPQRADGVTEVV